MVLFLLSILSLNSLILPTNPITSPTRLKYAQANELNFTQNDNEYEYAQTSSKVIKQ